MYVFFFSLLSDNRLKTVGIHAFTCMPESLIV